MYKEAYELLREILDDEILNDYVKNLTGKHLAVIDAGAQITTPAVKITFVGGEISRADNAMQTVRYNIAFFLPFWGTDALEMSHDFMDVAIQAFFDHEQRTNPARVNRVLRIVPSIVEEAEDSELWTVAFDATVSIFMY